MVTEIDNQLQEGTLLDMRRATAIVMLILAAVLSGCAVRPEPGGLILTEEDVRLKSRAPYCPTTVTHRVEAVRYYK